jgi:HlyD family secretion protein
MKPMLIDSFSARRSRWPLAGAAAALLLLAGCKKDEKEKEPVVTVQTRPVQRAPISQVIAAEAVVFPLQQAIITPKITSTISKFLVQRGSVVRQGQLLAVLENKDLSAAAVQSKGELDQAEAGYVTTVNSGLPQQIQKAELDAAAAKAGFEAQQKLYDSRKNLFEQGALPHRDLDSAQVALAQARGTYEVAQRQLDDLKRLGEKQLLKSANGQFSAAKGKYLGAEALLSYSEIRSPIDGVVTDRPLFPGELAAANQPLITVMNTSKLVAKSHIAQSEAVSLKVGNEAEVKVPGLEEPVKARVSLISPALDPGSTTIEVWVETLKPEPGLKPGMTVQVSMTARTVKDALVVPTPAVFKNPEGVDYVVLAGADGHAHIKAVQAGVRSAEFTQIVSGVIGGEVVITTGGYALPDNTQIKIEAALSEKDAADKPDNSKKTGGVEKPAAKDKE